MNTSLENPIVLIGDALQLLTTLPAACVQCCVTSPPYFGLRDYGVPGQIGLEKTPGEYVANLQAVFAEVRRVLKPDGTLWLNLGDTYAASGRGGGGHSFQHDDVGTVISQQNSRRQAVAGYKPKDLIGIPWLVAFALRADGWWLRSDIIWAKRNCMPESVTDRPTRSHEYIFLLTKSASYFYDHNAIKEPCLYDVDGTGTAARKARAHGNKLLPTTKINGIRPGGFKDAGKFAGKHGEKQHGHTRRHAGFNDRWDKIEREDQCSGRRNKRDVWQIAPANYPEAHFATFPPDLIKPCILAGSRPGDVVLDPFAGSGTTGLVALELGRKAILCELNPEYVKLIHQRCHVTQGLAL